MTKLITYKLNKVQITCPNCKCELQYNKKALEKRINYLGQKIKECIDKLERINKLPEEQINKPERSKIKKDEKKYQDLLSEYKLVYGTLREYENDTVIDNIKIALRQIGGEDLYKRVMDQALRDSTAYSIEDNMGIGYYSGETRISKIS